MQKIRHLWGDTRGAVLAEFAYALPLLILIVIAGVEVARYALLHQKVNGLAITVSDLVARQQTVSETDIANAFAAVDHVAKPFEIGDKGLVVISSVGASSGNPPVVMWQRSGAGTLTFSSQIGTEGNSATVPAGLQVRDGETVIVVEVAYSFTPMWAPEIVSPIQMYQTAFHRPRFGALSSVTP